MDRKGIVKVTKQDLEKMEKLDKQYTQTKNQHKKHQICLMENEYRDLILGYVQARDYPVAYTSNKVDMQLFMMWTQFLGTNTTQMHTALLANVHLSSTDKLIGAVIDTFIGFCYLSFTNIKIFEVNLNLIHLTTRIPLGQIRKSVRKLGHYAGYFDHSAHLDDD